MKVRTRWIFLLIAIAFVVAGTVGATAVWWHIDRNRLDPPKTILLAPEGTVNTLAYSPDGRHLAAGSGHAIVVWDRATRQLVRTLDHPTTAVVTSVAYSADGKRLASGCIDGHSAVWDAERGARLLTLQKGGYGPPSNRETERCIAAVRFSPDGQNVAAAHHPPHGIDTVPSEVHVWDAVNGKEKLVLKGHRGRVQAVAYSPDGMFLVSGDDKGDVKLWDSADGSLRRNLPQRHNILALSFVPKSGIVAYGGGWSQAADVVTMCDTETGLDTRLGLPQDNYGTYVMCLAFSPDSRTMATGEVLKDGKHPHCVRLWDVATGRVVRVFRCPAPAKAVAFSPDGTELAAGCTEDRPTTVGEVRIWDVPPKP